MGGLQDIQDERLRAAVSKELKKREKRRKQLIMFCVVIATGCIGYFSIYTYMNRRTQSESADWAKIKEESKSKVSDKEEEFVIHRTGETEIPDILPEYEILYNKNNYENCQVRIHNV